MVLTSSCVHQDYSRFDIQGHRGCRGLYPENTLAGFKHAVALGVHTLEMDVVINKDNEVIVSHEPFYHADITTKPDGSFLSQDSRATYNIYKMSRRMMDSLDVGMKPLPKFKNQRKIPATKPSLAEVFALFKEVPVRFNIEIKRKPADDSIFHPEASRFLKLVIDDVLKYDMTSRVNLQSFDIETLQILHRDYPEIPLAFLTDNRWLTLDDHLANLGFTPDIFSPQYKLVTLPLIRYCHSSGIKIIPWTVNNKTVMRKLMRWGVDGLITDYPDRLISLVYQNQ